MASKPFAVSGTRRVAWPTINRIKRGTGWVNA